MSLLALREFARCVPPITQRRFLSATSSKQISKSPAFRSANQPPERPEEIDRACGAPLNSTEAGPSTPVGILRPEAWIIGIGAVLTATGLYLFNSSNSAHAMGEGLLDQRKALEQHEGDREEEETDAQKMEEAEIIRNAAREKKMKGAKPGQ